MAGNPLRRCNRPGCRTLTRNDGGMCDAHQKRDHTTTKPIAECDQFASGRRWRKLRAMFIAEHPLCSDCFEAGRIRAVEEVHHIESRRDAPDRAYDVDNLMALCKSCHSRRTAHGE